MSVLSMTKSVFGIFKDVLVNEIRAEPIDTAPWFNSAVYLGALLFFGVSFWKAVIVAAIILFAIMYNYGRRTLIRGGMAVLFFTLAVWAEIIPDPSKWSNLARSVVPELR
jgi:hypothetical protein